MTVFVLIMLGLLFFGGLPAACVMSARAGIHDRNAAHRQLRAAYHLAGQTPPDGL